MRQLLPIAALAAGLTINVVAAVRPNIVWIIAEDLSPHLGCYGDKQAYTPKLDHLASEGIRYSNAFAHAGVCAPARSGLISGMYPSSIGSHHMRSLATLPGTMRILPELLRASGYYTGNESKTDYNFEAPAAAWSGTGEKAHWKHRPEGAPFFYVVNLFVTHESRVRLPAEEFEKETRHVPPERRRDPDQIEVPPYHPDTPKVRADWARYYEMTTEMDYQAGQILRELDEAGLRDNTIVFFFSDHGTGLPRSKQFIYDSGLRVPLIVRLPEKWNSLAPADHGTVADRLVSFVDFAPTVLSLCGVSIPQFMQGQAFFGKRGKARDYVYAIRDRMDERYDISRAVRDKRFKYHRNYMPYLPHYPWLEYMDQLETSKELRRLASEGRLNDGLTQFMAASKPLEELYDVERDPNELHDLAEQPEYAEILKRLRTEHKRWVLETVDTGFIPEQILRDGAKRLGSESAFARSSHYPLERVLNTALLMDEGGPALPRLVDRLADANPIVRFWAAAGITAARRNGATAYASSQTALLEVVENDPEPEVRIAAAEALCVSSCPESALHVLASHLLDERWAVRLFAANVVDRIGMQAKPLSSEIQRAVEASIPTPRYARPYLGWLLNHALRLLQPQGTESKSQR